MSRSTGSSTADIEAARSRSISPLLETQRRLLELIVTGAPRQRVLDTLCEEVERFIPGTACWVMELGVDRLRLAAAPSVPRHLVSRLDGFPRDAGTCWAAIGEGRMVVTHDTSLDPLWSTLRESAAETGIRSCWSIPIRSTGPEVMGTFAITSPTPGSPREEHLTLLEIAGHVAGIAMVRDMDARSMRSLESKYRAIFDATSDPIFVHDADTGAIIDVNRKMCEKFGYRYDEALRLDLGDVSFGGTAALDRAIELVTEAAAGRPQLFEWQCRHRDGHPFWCEVSLRSAVIGDEPRVLAIARDISERRRTLEALRESEANLRTITNNSPDYIMLLDLEQRIQFMNRTVPDLTVEEVLGRALYEFIEPRFHPRIAECFEGVRMTGEPGWFEVDYVMPGGSVLVFESRVAPVVKDDTIVAFAVSSSDCTKRRLAERALFESEERFRQIAESINEVFWLSDWKKRRVIYVSPSYESIWGLPFERLHQDPTSWKEALHPDDRKRVTSTFYRDAPLGKYDIEFRVVWPDGSVHWVHEKAFPIRNEHGEVHRVAGICENITGRKEFEAELRRKSETEALLLRELNHRVRNNLSSLVSLIDITRRDATDVERFAATIRGRVHAMATAHDFLSRSQWATVGLEVLLRALVPVEATDRVGCAGPEIVVGPDQANSLAMVLHELITNSLKHGALGDDSGRVDVTWTAVDTSPSSRRVTMGWRERGGPAIEHEPKASIGSSLIAGLIKADLKGDVRLRYPSSGADHELEFVLEVLDGGETTTDAPTV